MSDERKPFEHLFDAEGHPGGEKWYLNSPALLGALIVWREVGGRIEDVLNEPTDVIQYCLDLILTEYSKRDAATAAVVNVLDSELVL